MGHLPPRDRVVKVYLQEGRREQRVEFLEVLQVENYGTRDVCIGKPARDAGDFVLRIHSRHYSGRWKPSRVCESAASSI
jgi:hypothetical protein